MTTKIKIPSGTSKIRVARENAKRIKVAAASADVDMETMANRVIDAGLKALKIK